MLVVFMVNFIEISLLDVFTKFFLMFVMFMMISMTSRAGDLHARVFHGELLRDQSIGCIYHITLGVCHDHGDQHDF